MMNARADITVVGLGPGDARLLTQESISLLRGSRVFLRTRIHPTLESLHESAEWASFDDLYERLDTFGEVYTSIVDRLIDAAQDEPIVYAVPGHPLFGEATVRLLLARAREQQLAIKVLPAVSFLDTVAPVLGLDPVDTSLQIVDALELVSVVDRLPYAGGQMPLSPLRPAIIAQVYSPVVASAVKLALLQLYPDDHGVTLVIAAGNGGQVVKTMPLFEIDRAHVDHLSSVFVPALDPLSGVRVTEGLQRIVARLRAPGGCPWDREQTHESLTRHMLEEAYEVIHAIEEGTPADLAEELGDVLLQVYLHAQIAEEAGEFSLEDVIQTLSAKLVRRHPHVFGDRSIATAGEVVKAWDQIKQEERSGTTDGRGSLFGSIPSSLPALARAQTMLRRARSHGLDVAAILHRAQQSVEGGDAEALIACRLAEILANVEERDIDAERALRLWTNEFERAANCTNMNADT